MRNTIYILSLFALISAVGCKKDADVPPEIRPSDFFARCTISTPDGITQPFFVQGEQTIVIDSIGNLPLEATLKQQSNYFIAPDSNKYTWGGLYYDLLFKWGIGIRLCRDEKITSTEQYPEWRKEELDALLVPGREFSFGDAPGQAQMVLNQWMPAISVGGNDQPLSDAFLRLESVDDYGSPEAGIPYYGKIARFRFGGSFDRGGYVQKISNGEAVIFFRYFNY